MLPGDKETKESKQSRRTITFAPGDFKGDHNFTLRHLFNRIIADCGITPSRWDRLIMAYVRKMEDDQGQKLNTVEKKAEANKQFTGDSPMTWKKWFKGMTFMRAKKVTYWVEIEHANGQVTRHGLTTYPNPDITENKEIDYAPTKQLDQGFIFSGEYPSTAAPAPRVAPPDIEQYAGKYPAPGAADPDSRGPSSST